MGEHRKKGKHLKQEPSGNFRTENCTDWNENFNDLG
jgi:hypothetical protein